MFPSISTIDGGMIAVLVGLGEMGEYSNFVYFENPRHFRTGILFIVYRYRQTTPFWCFQQAILVTQGNACLNERRAPVEIAFLNSSKLSLFKPEAAATCIALLQRRSLKRYVGELRVVGGMGTIWHRRNGQGRG
jgi:hypothetical protein